uniref:ATP-dependent DNA helicase n=1 Tax=Tanacetum cinerariifolium TaxID=118510 RepID=A0A6L2NF89_TANCI|nr:hypothetical protein [Tanacetum cinerariifolium]
MMGCFGIGEITRLELSTWNDYPAFYSFSVVRLVLSCYVARNEGLTEWILVNSPFYGVAVNDVFVRDCVMVLFRVCLRAIVREAIGYMRLVSRGENRFECRVLREVMMWLGEQFGVLYGEMNGKMFAINMLKQWLMIGLSGSVFFGGEQRVKEPSVGPAKGVVSVSELEVAVVALRERAALEARIKAIRASRFVPAYQRAQEHQYITKLAEEERKKRSDYRPIIEHDGVLWHRGDNQDANKNKSREELLAEERDYKRRRMSYRGKKMKRSTTQVMRDIIDECMEEIKHANLANQPSVDATNLASEPSSMINAHSDKHRHDESEYKSYRKEPVSDISKRSARPEDYNKEKSYFSFGNEHALIRIVIFFTKLAVMSYPGFSSLSKSVSTFVSFDVLFLFFDAHYDCTYQSISFFLLDILDCKGSLCLMPYLFPMPRKVMRDIIDEYMEEIKHANLANQPSVDATNLASEPSSMINPHSDKHRHDESEYKSYRKEPVSDISKRSARPEDYNKEKSNYNDDRRRSTSRSRDHRQRDDRKRSRKYYTSSPDRGHLLRVMSYPGFSGLSKSVSTFVSFDVLILFFDAHYDCTYQSISFFLLDILDWIASLLLPGGRTAHSRFVIPFELTDNSTCGIKQNTHLAELMQQVQLIIWDVAPMTQKYAFEALDKTLRGDETLPAKIKEGEDEAAWIEIPERFLIKSWESPIEWIMEETYLDFTTRQIDDEYLKEKATLTPRNDDADAINAYMFKKLEGGSITYNSADEICKASTDTLDQQDLYPVEFLNS